MKHALSETRTTWMQRIFPLFSLIFLFGAFFAVSLEANAATWKVYSNLLTKSCGTESPSGSGNWTPTSNVSCPTDGSTCSTVGQQVGCGTCSCAYNIPRCMLGSTAQCEDSSGSGGGSGCGTAAKSYSYTDTSFSGSICRAGWRVVASDGSGSVSFPAAGSSVTWRCTISTSPSSTCTATRSAAPITCGSANGGTFSASGPPSSGLCSDGSRPTVSYRLSGGYKIGFSWTCGTNSCSANLSPGVCGSANGTTISTAPSTASELCSFGSASSISGSGPWTWSCTGTSCRANKTVPSCTPSCPNPALYCTTTPIYDTNCGTYCGNGTTNCSTPRLIVCPASASLSPGGMVQLNARYWSNLASVPSCSTTGYSTVTTSSTWSSLNTLVATVNNVSPKGLVTAGSPAVTSLANIRAFYNNRQAFGGVTVMSVSSGPSGTINATPCTIPLNGSSCTSTVSWNSSNFSGPTSVRQNGTSFSSSGSNTGTSRSVSFSNNTFTLVDTGSAFTTSATASVSCASGVWDGSKCVAAACLCDPLENAAQCVGVYTNSCGASCTGTRDCDQPWVEVRP